MPQLLLERYELTEILGEGAMGTVYRGHDQRLARDVAIKLLRADTLASEDARRQFRREALALSKLNHPNIASIFDFGTQDGTDFIVMELVAGRTLGERLRLGPMSEAEIERIGAQLTDGLEAAHRAGVIHRDLKPANLRLTSDGRLKILDFGIAQQAPAAGAEGETLTLSADGTTAGTPAYMAPEQLLGATIDCRSDVYGAGAVLYQMATGRPPHDGPNPFAIMDAALHQDPAAPRALNPRLSPALEAVIQKALDKDPARRHQSALELGVDLQRLQAGQAAAPAAVAPPASARDPRRRWWALGLSAASAIALAIVVAWVVSTRTALSFTARDWILVSDVQNDTGNPLFDRSLGTAFRISLEQSSHANVLPAPRVADAMRRMGKEKGAPLDEETAREVCIRENARGLVTATVSRVGSQYLLSAHLVNPATGAPVRSYSERADSDDHILDALDRIARSVRRDLGESLSSIQQGSRPLPQVTTRSLKALNLFAEGTHLWEKGDYNNGVRQFKAALDEDPDFATAHASLGGCYMSFVFHDRVQGREHLERALALSDRTTERERLQIQLRYAEELGTAQEAEHLFGLYLAKYPDDTAIRYNYGSSLMRWNRPADAVRELTEVTRSAPNYASAYINLATSYSKLGKPGEALANYDKAFVLEPTWKMGGNLNHEYGFTLVRHGDVAKAREVFSLPLAKPDTRDRALRSTALLDAYEGRYRRAIDTFRDAAIDEEVRKQALSASRDRLFLAVALDRVGDRTGALREADAAHAAWRLLGPQVWMGARVGQVYARLGAVPKAVGVLDTIRPQVERNNVEQQAAAHLLEGEIELARGHAARAVEVMEVSRREDDDPMTVAALGRATEAAKLIDRSVAHRRALVADRDNSLGWEAQDAWLQAHHDLARLLAGQGKNDEAKTFLDELLRLWKDSDGSPTLLGQAKALRAGLVAGPGR